MTASLTHQHGDLPNPVRGELRPSTQEPSESLHLFQSSASSDDGMVMPDNVRASTDNSDDQAESASPRPAIALPYRPRNTSPSDVTRPHSSGGLSTLPQMQRAYSSPGVDSSGRFISPTQPIPRRPSSPLSAGRRRSPMRTYDESFPNSWSGLNIEPNIPEHAELELSGPTTPEDGLGSMGPTSLYSNTFPRSRRRPTSPLHQSASAPSLYPRSASPHQLSGTPPLLGASKFANEPYPTYSFSSTSSMPSTPTSFRSRSPSISSLETIEDTPDAEEAARIEAEEARLNVDDNTTDSRRRSLDRASGLRSNKERKRWSVCGAERRADFSLEVIEE